MKAVILAGGYGTRISEESHLRPKPMIEIGGMPILWHIMKIYYYYGVDDFIICAGYKQNIIKEWFANYFLHTSDITFDFSKGNEMIIHNRRSEKWKVTVVDTGLNTMTGGRIKRIKDYLEDDEPFFLTYGDGVSDINIKELLQFHCEHKKLITLSAIRPESRFGVLEVSDNKQIVAFREKNNADSGWINAGFMVLSLEVINYIKDDTTVFEKEPLESMAEMGQLMCYEHTGFWQCMDTMRDKERLEKLWMNNKAPWKVWRE